MNKRQSITILQEYNDWRRGAEIPQPPPNLIGKAIDFAIGFMKGEKK